MSSTNTRKEEETSTAAGETQNEPTRSERPRRANESTRGDQGSAPALGPSSTPRPRREVASPGTGSMGAWSGCRLEWPPERGAPCTRSNRGPWKGRYPAPRASLITPETLGSVGLDCQSPAMCGSHNSRCYLKAGCGLERHAEPHSRFLERSEGTQQNGQPGAALPGRVCRTESRSHHSDMDIGRGR
ncbi:hypothetical protein NDU88_000337 [Pleurodeles waltl]|uniref:Uncharacterized protein n=1 Tax=Pleurodeles waltl TaxID=8319 RepID=A0AAV7P5D6_PLEWA|nr:hypothetical protein NDU88_000337 [Pleurodeles waltl]